ncbi:Solute carrier organic anion transporter family member 3A1 [Holothuria leucospilota]|uniref:Solute carrier organic anion transporter family member 3A1 n=1 Tax=Holothuria leucospilota TaxID=206669 RepID=A0A9Q1CG08_HOLLE|nr:Solute carrier organic anion transporter family member 3A1 [Holothuria leucospilota]
MAGKMNLYKTFFNTFTFVAMFTISSLALTTSSGYLSSVISTVEQRFQLKSTESSLLFTVDDAVSFSTVLFVTHFGNSASKPKLISFLFLLVAIGTVFQTMPHFLYEPPGSIQPSQGGRGGGGGGRGGGGGGKGGGTQLSDQFLCDNSSIVIDNCTSKEIMNSGALWYQVWWLYLGKALAGFAISTNPLAITYLDDSPARNYLPIFIAIIYGFRSTGSSIGGFIAQQCLSVPASWPLVTSDTVTNPNDPQYLGAWWLGFIPISVMAFCPALLLFFFPRVMSASGDSDKTPDKSSMESDTKTSRRRGRRRREREDPNKSIVSEDTNAITTQEPSSRVRRIFSAIIGGLIYFSIFQ